MASPGSAIHTVAVAGVGLIGGSFALALRDIGFRGRILGVSSPRTLETAERLGVIDEGCAMDVALPQADLIYMAQPVEVIAEQLATVRKLAPGHALVTDAGSTKGEIVRQASELFGGGPHFVGGHPMAGRDGRGVEIAEAGLFRGATYVLVPASASMPRSSVIDQFRAWLDLMGCRQLVMDAAEHDAIVAWTSHLPQLASTALAATIGRNVADRNDLAVAGDGFRDMTRLAASPHAVWSGILRTNKAPIDFALRCFIQELEDLRAALQSDAAEDHFARGQDLRRRPPAG